LERDRTKVPRRLTVVAATLLATLVTALGADWVVRDRDAAVARTTFAATRRELSRALAFRFQTFAAMAELSTMLPILRQVAAARDQASFGPGAPAAERRHP